MLDFRTLTISHTYTPAAPIPAAIAGHISQTAPPSTQAENIASARTDKPSCAQPGPFGTLRDNTNIGNQD